ncbi:hypothetical protein [Blastococcus sp. SYSU D00695]
MLTVRSHSWLPDSRLKTDGGLNWFLPSMSISLRTLWKLADRMAEDMGQPASVFTANGTSYMGGPAYSRVERGQDLAPGRSYADGVRLMATDGLTLQDGVLNLSSASPGVSIDFPRGDQAGVVGMFGSSDQFVPYRPKLEATIDWLVRQGRYRWGWLLPLSIGGSLLLVLLLSGLVVSSVLTARAGYAAVTVPFFVITGVATTWVIGAGTLKLIREDRRKRRGVVVNLHDRA